MKTENFSLANANDVKIFHTLTRVIRYDEGAGVGTPLIRVRSLTVGGLDVEMKPGKLIKLPASIEGIVITNLTANPITGKFTIGAGDIEDNNLSGTVTLDAAGLAALESTDLNPASLNTLRQPLAPTGNWGHTAALVAVTPVNIFTPAANVNGAILLSAGWFQTSPSVAPVINFLAKNAAPTSMIDGEVMPLTTSIHQGGTYYLGTGKMEAPQYIAPGLGLYIFSNDAQTALAAGIPSHRHARYRLL